MDDLARFFSADGIVTVVERRPRDANFAALRDNLERLRSMRTPSGGRFAVAELPMPTPCRYRGTRLPASYANFLVINGAVLMPAFRQPRKDSEAADVLRSCFPGREIIPIDCLELVGGLGTSTLHLPAATRFNDMKMLSLLALGCSVALLSACESDLGEDVHAALAPREAPRSRVFQADTRTTYEAARAAAATLGYRFIKGGAAEGEFNALSSLSDDTSSDAATGNSTQISMRVRLSIADPSGTEVSVSFGEIVESASRNEPGIATETPLRDTPLFEVFFREVQRALDMPKTGTGSVSH